MRVLLLNILIIMIFICCSISNKKASDFYHSGIAKEKKGDYDSAISDFTKAIKINSKYYKAYNNRGLAKYNISDFDGSILDYSKAIKIDPKYYKVKIRRNWI